MEKSKKTEKENTGKTDNAKGTRLRRISKRSSRTNEVRDKNSIITDGDRSVK